jgi:hypothetical protein
VSDGFAEHWPFAVLFLIGAIVRLLMMIAYPPALFFDDSWGYLFSAFAGHPVALSYLRPNGYAFLLHFVTLPGRGLVRLTALQHLSGLLTGTLVYAGLVRAAAPRLLALIAAALILVDGYVITVEQYVMPEAFFTVTLLVAVLVVVWPRLRSGEPTDLQPSMRSLLVAGLLCAAAVIQREAALFVAPVFIIYLLWTRVRLRSLVAFVVAGALPLLGYAVLYDAKLGVFGLTESSGWTLYGRVAAFADCSKFAVSAAQRALCETPRQKASHPSSPTYYIWNSSSPADRVFRNGHQTRQIQRRSDRIVGSFAHHVIAHQPVAYARAVGTDFVRYFAPGATPFNDAVSATSLPAAAVAEPVNQRYRRQFIPNAHITVQAPAGALRTYRRLVHVPRPLLALLALASLLAVARRTRSQREIALLSVSAIALLLGTAATAGFGLRYLLPAVPLLALGGGLASRDLLSWLPSRSTNNATRFPRRGFSQPL